MSMAKFYNYQDEREEELLAPTYKVAAYCRLSKEDDDIRGGESVSISHQKEMIEEFCARKGWEINADCPFLVRVTAKDLRIRKGAGTDTAWTGKYVPPGVYTIVEVKAGKGSDAGWGRLKSDTGWIALDYCQRV